MTNLRTGTSSNDELFPGFDSALTDAVNAAVIAALADLDVVNLKLCQDELARATRELARSRAQAEVWQEVASRRKTDLDVLQEQVASLQARVAFLESAIENYRTQE